MSLTAREEPQLPGERETGYGRLESVGQGKGPETESRKRSKEGDKQAGEASQGTRLQYANQIGKSLSVG